jgi:hypothetical protein
MRVREDQLELPSVGDVVAFPGNALDPAQFLILVAYCSNVVCLYDTYYNDVTINCVHIDNFSRWIEEKRLIVLKLHPKA